MPECVNPFCGCRKEFPAIIPHLFDKPTFRHSAGFAFSVRGFVLQAQEKAEESPHCHHHTSPQRPSKQRPLFRLVFRFGVGPWVHPFRELFEIPPNPGILPIKGVFLSPIDARTRSAFLTLAWCVGCAHSGIYRRRFRALQQPSFPYVFVPHVRPVPNAVRTRDESRYPA